MRERMSRRGEGEDEFEMEGIIMGRESSVGNANAGDRQTLKNRRTLENDARRRTDGQTDGGWNDG